MKKANLNKIRLYCILHNLNANIIHSPELLADYPHCENCQHQDCERKDAGKYFITGIKAIGHRLIVDRIQIQEKKPSSKSNPSDLLFAWFCCDNWKKR